jgi:predicted membrane protein
MGSVIQEKLWPIGTHGFLTIINNYIFSKPYVTSCPFAGRTRTYTHVSRSLVSASFQAIFYQESFSMLFLLLGLRSHSFNV